MNDQETTILKQSAGSDPKIKRNSGLFSFLRWFKSSSRESVNSDVQNSGTSGSSESLNSTGTVASFSFVAPNAYAKPKVCEISPGPETDTYRARLKQRDRIRERDKNITLRKKYNLFFNKDTLQKPKFDEDSSKSLPLMTRKMDDERGHRRTNSDSSKTKRAGAYLHVKGKRKAPQPPRNQDTLSLRRKKRLAPQPPSVSTERVMNTLQAEDTIEYADADILFNDSLKLDHGILKSAKGNEITNKSPNTSARSSLVEAPVSPRPWYKRNIKKDNKYEPVEKLTEIKINKELKIDKKEDKRKSNMLFLTNISELDREATEILKKEHKKNEILTEMPEFMRPKPEEANTDSLISPKRKSAKDLIAKFNAITNVTKVTVNSAFFRESSVFQKRDYFGKQGGKAEEKTTKNNNFLPLSKAETSACIIKPATPKIERKSWFCPKCNVVNDYWRIICHVCSTIKPYFDDLTAPPKNNSIEKKNEIKEASTTGPSADKNTSLGENPLERSKTQIGFAALTKHEQNKKEDIKREEREKLKKMLIEMKNSLPKRKSNIVYTNRKSTIEEKQEQGKMDQAKTSDPNLNKEDGKLADIDVKAIKKDEEVKQLKPLKVSSSAQTSSSVVKKAANDKDFQLMRPKDFEDIYSEKSGKANVTHLYANLAQNENLFLNMPKRFSEIKNLNLNTNNTDTLEINRLLRRLENAIAKGDLRDAAIYARELAQLKVNCSVVRQKSIEKNEAPAKNGFTIDMYVEDRLSHRGPFPIQVAATQTVAELKKQVEKEFEIPAAVQRWILGKELATDENATLEDHNVTTAGCPVFLYLVAPGNNSNVKQEQPAKYEQKITAEPKLEEAAGIERKEINVPAISIIKKEFVTSVPRVIDVKLKIEEKKVQEVELKQVERVKVQLTGQPSTSGLGKSESRAPPKAVEEDFTEYDKTLTPNKTWECTVCTLINPTTCQICSVCASRRINIVKVETEKKVAPKSPKTKHYLELMNLDSADLVTNSEPFECLVCFTEIPNGEGVTLRECLHQFCKACLAYTIEFNDEAEVKCPYRDEQYSCDIALQDREIKALVTPVMYDQFLAKSVAQAENKIDKSFHCKTPDCKGWCIFEDNVNEFRCPVCRKNNCLTCQAIHDGMNCKQYQERMNVQSETDEDAKRTREMLEEMVNKGEALTCPACQVILMKKWGCDWVRCSMCKTEICWVTKGLRWGPGGKGDTTGGCKCGVNGIKCHPQCNYCH